MNRDKKIVVTGATGLAGSHLVAELLRSGYGSITVVVRNPGSLEKLRKTLSREGLEERFADLAVAQSELNNPHTLADALEGADVVFNCAGVVTVDDDRTVIQRNVEITAHVVDAALAKGVGRLVHISSIAALGEPTEGKKIVDETSEMQTTEGVLPYGVSKFLSENEVRRGAALGLRTVTVNPAIILGPEVDGSSSVIVPLLARGTCVYTEGVEAFVDVRDVARAMVLLSGLDDVVGQRFVLSAENLSFRELFKMGNAAIGRKPPRIRLRAGVLHLAASAVGILGRLSGKHFLFNHRVARYMTHKNYYSGEKITSVTGFAYTPMRQTVERLVKQYLAEKNG